MIDTDDIDKLLAESDEGGEPDGRAGLQAGAGLEIEGPDSGYGSLPDIEADFETPAWLRAGIDGSDAEIDSPADERPSPRVEVDEASAAKPSKEVPAPREKRQVVHESRRTRRALIVIAAVAACIAAASTYMFNNSIGPFAPAAPEAPSQEPEPPVMEGETDLDGWVTAGAGYEDLYALIMEQTRGIAGTADGGEHGQEDRMSMDYYDSFSRINEQVEGVREADVMATDGEYIFTINSNDLSVVRIGGNDMELVTKIAQPAEDEQQVYFEMFLYGDRLIALRHGVNQSALQLMPGNEDMEVPTASIWYPFGGQIVDTSIDIFDISDLRSPVKMHTLSQSGSYVSSRMVGDHVYLITTYYGDVPKMKPTDPKTFVPLYARDGEQFLPLERDIFITPGSAWPSYTVISGIDAMGSGDFISLKAVYGDVGTVYASHDAVYLVRMASEELKEPGGTLPPPSGSDEPGIDYVQYTNWSETLLAKMTIAEGRVEPKAQAKVPGYMTDKFSLDEYHGALRLMTTVDLNVWYGFIDPHGIYTSDDWAQLPAGTMETESALYTLDENLLPLGKIDDIAPGERVNASRFVEDAAYFMTYNKTDPLVSVDLSDPAAPRVAGKLEIGWLPDFLKPYSDGLLFGLGRDMDVETGSRLDLMLMMFDDGDPAGFREIHSASLGGKNSAAEENPEAILVSADKSLVVFPVDGSYMVFGYDAASGFEKKAELKLENDDNMWAEVRGLFIDDVFYIVSPNSISAYAADDGFKRVGNLRIGEGAGLADRFFYSRGFL